MGKMQNAFFANFWKIHPQKRQKITISKKSLKKCRINCHKNFEKKNKNCLFCIFAFFSFCPLLHEFCNRTCKKKTCTFRCCAQVLVANFFWSVCLLLYQELRHRAGLQHSPAAFNSLISNYYLSSTIVTYIHPLPYFLLLFVLLFAFFCRFFENWFPLVLKSTCFFTKIWRINKSLLS